MDEKEKAVIRKVLGEMRNAYGVIGFFLKGTAVELTLADWIHQLKSLLPEGQQKCVRE